MFVKKASQDEKNVEK